MTVTMLIAGLAVLAAATVLDLAVGVRNPVGRAALHLLCAVAGILLLIAGLRAATGLPGRVGLDDSLASGTTGLTLDALSGLFLAIASAVAAPVALVFTSWSRSTDRLRRRGLGTLHALTLAAVTLIITADNAFVFFFAWEGLTFLFYLRSASRGTDRAEPGRAS